MTQGDLTAYWGAVAQIIPVLALAFVIEARVIVGRMSKKSAYKYRGLRIRWSIAFFLLAALLTASEFAALQSLTYDPDKPLRVVDHVYYWISLISVAASLLVVITQPISSLISASVGDVIRSAELHVPWGKAQRLRREIHRQRERIEHHLREGQSNRLDALHLCADALLDEDGDDAEAMQQEFLRALDESPKSQSAVLVDLTSDLRKLLESDPREPLWGYHLGRWFYEAHVQADRDLRKLHKQFGKQLRRVDKITDVNSPEFVKIQRANMAAAAKMP